MTEEYLGQVRRSRISGWMDYARSTEEQAIAWAKEDPETRRVVHWIDKSRVIWPAPRMWLCVNVWDADVYGNGEHTGLRWTVYENDPEMGAMTHDIHDSGAFPITDDPEINAMKSDDDWLFGLDAVQFLCHVRPGQVIEVIDCQPVLPLEENER